MVSITRAVGRIKENLASYLEPVESKTVAAFVRFPTYTENGQAQIGKASHTAWITFGREGHNPLAPQSLSKKARTGSKYTKG